MPFKGLYLGLVGWMENWLQSFESASS
jgi:hypothetical protein